MAQGSTVVFQAGSRTWKHLCRAGLAATQRVRVTRSWGACTMALGRSLWDQPGLGSGSHFTYWVPKWATHDDEKKKVNLQWRLKDVEDAKMCSICEAELQAPRGPLEIRWCHLVSQMCRATGFIVCPVGFQSFVGLIFPWLSVALPFRNRDTCFVSLKQDNLFFDFTEAHS